MDEVKDLKELIPILVFLLPGFMTAKLFDLLVVAKPKDTFEKILQAFVFTFINLLCFSVVRWLIEHFFAFRFDRAEFFTAGNLVLMIFCATGVAFACSYEMKNELLLEWLRKTNITKKTYKPSTWGDTFSQVERYVVVHLNDNRRIYGWPRFYSDDPAERGIYLEDASWLGEDNKFVNDQPISILLDANSGIQLIEFLPKPDAEKKEKV